MVAEPRTSCDQIDDIARRHLAIIDRRLGGLTTLKAEPQRMVGDRAPLQALTGGELE